MTLTEFGKWFSFKSTSEKIEIAERLLFEMTMINEAICGAEFSDKQKFEGLKRSNKLVSQIWNLLFDLKKGKDEESGQELCISLLNCAKESPELRIWLPNAVESVAKFYNS